MDEHKTPIKRPRPKMGHTDHTVRRRALTGAAGVALLGGLVALPTTGAVADSGRAAPEAGPPSYKVLASGLNNPRHLSLSHGALYVAESGTGGDGPCITNSEGSRVCYGATGSITKVTPFWPHWRQQRVVTGLPSLAGPDGGQATGPSDVEVKGRYGYVVSTGLGAPPAARQGLGPAGPTFGALLEGRFAHPRTWFHLGRQHRGPQRDGWRVLADIAGHEAVTNPIDGPDSNPASVLRRGSHYVVADAGGNTVVAANRRGGVRTLAAFPDGLDQPPSRNFMQFVPTSAVIGPDGALYVSQLTGFPFPQGGSKIYRVAPGHAPQVYATGLTNVTDLAFGQDGCLYAVQISSAGLASGGPPIGAVVKVARNGHGSNTVIADGLFAPYGIAVAWNSAFVTTGGVLAGGGQVIQIPLN
ncbi:MAG: ScyD/ScyE family protein [Nocardioidaceae bacterium]